MSSFDPIKTLIRQNLLHVAAGGGPNKYDQTI